MMAASSRPPRSLAGNAFKGAGLLRDEDASMRDVTKGSKKKIPKKASHGHRQRTVDLYKTSGAADLSQKMLASRLSANLSNPLAVRGAALKQANVRFKGVARVNPLDVWGKVVEKRYNPEAKFLDLERLADDELLKRNNIAIPGRPGSTNKEYAVVFKFASRLKPPVETISLANNNILHGGQITSLPHYIPDLRNLSLQGNKLRSWKDLDQISLKSRKLAQLREMIFIGNPLRDTELGAGRGEQYKSGMMRRFPMLEVLDQEAITKISFVDEPIASSSNTNLHDQSGPDAFSLNMAPSFITGVDGTVISSFLSHFFPLFDAQRAALADVYDPKATFSYSAYTQIPPRARIQGWHTSPAMPNQRKLEWGPWLRNASGGSRNLSFLSGGSGDGLERELRSLHTGPNEIVKAMTHLPRTRHEISGAAEKFCIDAWPVGQGAATMLFLCIHGDFAEEPSQGIRSFDRSFILAPTQPGSRAAMSGWAVTVLSDQLTVRPFSSPDAWKPGPLKVQGDGHRSSNPLPQTPQKRLRQPDVQQRLMTPNVQAMLNGIPDPQRSLVAQICQRTGLNVKFAVDCLENNGWDLQRAVANFEEVKATLGQEAYL